MSDHDLDFTQLFPFIDTSTLPFAAERLIPFITDPIRDAREFFGDFQNNISITINNDFAEITEMLDNILGEMRDRIDSGLDDAGKEYPGSLRDLVDHNLKMTVPFMQTVLNLSRGIGAIADMPLGAAVVVTGSIQNTMELMETIELIRIRDGIMRMTAQAANLAQTAIDTARETGVGIVTGITKAIDDAISIAALLIIDPIARLLRAILDAIQNFPTTVVDEIFRQLLVEIPQEVEES